MHRPGRSADGHQFHDALLVCLPSGMPRSVTALHARANERMVRHPMLPAGPVDQSAASATRSRVSGRSEDDKMTDLNLTRQERDLAAAMCHAGETWSILLYYASVLVPALSFASYGVFRRDLASVVIGLAGLLIFLVYRIAREFTYLKTYRSLGRKILDHEGRVTAGNVRQASPGSAELHLL